MPPDPLQKASKLRELAATVQEWPRPRYLKKQTGKEKVTKTTREASRRILQLLIDYLGLIEESRRNFGLHESLVQTIRSLQHAASLDAETLGRCWNWRDLFIKPIHDRWPSFPDELCRWADRWDRLGHIVDYPTPTAPDTDAKAEAGAAKHKDKRRRGRPSDSGDTDRKLDAAILKEWRRGYKSGDYGTKADFAIRLPDKLRKKIPACEDLVEYLKAAIDRARKR